jgi:hypothetical protein
MGNASTKCVKKYEISKVIRSHIRKNLLRGYCVADTGIMLTSRTLGIG